MSAASSRSSSFVFEDEPDEPAPPCRPWKYLEHPDAKEWKRGPLEVHDYPNLGDFVVLSIDAIASVAHLDIAAKQAARQLPRRKYVALCHQTTGLPIPTKPTHPYDFLFVRQGRPHPRLLDVDSEDSCIAVLPNNVVVSDQPPVRPAYPLPWDDCYLDTTYGFPHGCRVTCIDRDYVPVLPILDSEAMRIEQSLQDHWSPLLAERRRREDNWPEPLDLVALPPLPSPQVHEEQTAKATPVLPPAEPSLEPTSAAEMGANQSHHADDNYDAASLIESDDESEDIHSPESGGDEELDTFLAFETMMNDVGSLRDPVVNVWYDLDMVTKIVDPIHFLEDVKRLRIIVDEAEIRLGIRPDPAIADRSSVSGTSEDNDSHDQPALLSSVNTAATVDSVQSTHKDKHTHSLTKPSLGLGARLATASSRLLSPARSLMRRLVYKRSSAARSRVAP
ncbi:unnamed protein product [Peniophora sp. CBMAI 1063]|nr:unnamed protein product [Peniophora sp. CBMAI 1063]